MDFAVIPCAGSSATSFSLPKALALDAIRSGQIVVFHGEFLCPVAKDDDWTTVYSVEAVEGWTHQFRAPGFVVRDLVAQGKLVINNELNGRVEYRYSR